MIKSFKQWTKTNGLGLLTLIFSYFLIRFPLFHLHGMKDWPLFMFVIALISFLLLERTRKNKSMASLGYPISFVISLVFSSRSYDQGGGVLSDGWKLWLIIYLCIVIVTFIVDRKREV